MFRRDARFLRSFTTPQLICSEANSVTLKLHYHTSSSHNSIQPQFSYGDNIQHGYVGTWGCNIYG
jgi:hypothetical protein